MWGRLCFAVNLSMATDLTSYLITETPELSNALDAAAFVWPEYRDNRTALLEKIIEQGSLAIKAQSRLSAIKNIAADYSGLWPANWRQEYLLEWPE